MPVKTRHNEVAPGVAPVTEKNSFRRPATVASQAGDAMFRERFEPCERLALQISVDFNACAGSAEVELLESELQLHRTRQEL